MKMRTKKEESMCYKKEESDFLKFLSFFFFSPTPPLARSMVYGKE